jgi:hypothetical protein
MKSFYVQDKWTDKLVTIATGLFATPPTVTMTYSAPLFAAWGRKGDRCRE